MAQGIVTYDAAPGTRAKSWQALVDPSKANAVCLGFDRANDYSALSVIETTSPTAAAAAGDSAYTITAGGSKVRHLFPNFGGTLNANDMLVEVKIKRNDADVASSGLFVGFAESTTAGDIISTAGALRTAASSKDLVGWLCVTATANLVYYASNDATEEVASVDSGYDMENDTYVTLGVEVRGQSVLFFRDGVLVKQYDGVMTSAASVVPVVAVAGADAATVDHIVFGKN
jgi:hypothetical protein